LPSRLRIVVGSQAILGTFREDALPADATMSGEIDTCRSPTATTRRHVLLTDRGPCCRMLAEVLIESYPGMVDKLRGRR
jgi:hypothetical protein